MHRDAPRHRQPIPARRVERVAASDADSHCPGCGSEAIKFCPLPTPWNFVRALWLLLMAAIPVAAISRWVVPPEFVGGLNAGIERTIVPWLVMVLTIGILLLFVRRHKRCTVCGHEWPAKIGEVL